MSLSVAPGAEVTPGLDRRTELREFLRSRRARLRPADVGLLSHGRRRVPGLRREELAQLAGVSYAYYARLEQGYGESMSAEVLDAVARALRLTEEERDHLVRLAQPGRRVQAREVPAPPRLRPGVQNLLDALGVPAYVVSRRLDILGWNRLAATVFGDWSGTAPRDAQHGPADLPVTGDARPVRRPRRHGPENRRRPAHQRGQEPRRPVPRLTDP